MPVVNATVNPKGQKLAAHLRSLGFRKATIQPANEDTAELLAFYGTRVQGGGVITLVRKDLGQWDVAAASEGGEVAEPLSEGYYYVTIPAGEVDSVYWMELDEPMPDDTPPVG